MSSSWCSSFACVTGGNRWIDSRNGTVGADVGRAHACLSGRSENERDRVQAWRDFRPGDADRGPPAARSTGTAVSAVAASFTTLPARLRWVASGAARPTLAAGLSARSLSSVSAISAMPSLEQGCFDADVAVVGNHGERSPATAARLPGASAATGITALATTSADAERDHEISAAERVTSGTAAPRGAPGSGSPRSAFIDGSVLSFADRAETEERRRAWRAVDP